MGHLIPIMFFVEAEQLIDNRIGNAKRIPLTFIEGVIMATRMKKDEMLRLSEKVCGLLNEGFSFKSINHILDIRRDTLSKCFILGIEKGIIDPRHIEEKIFNSSTKIYDLPLKEAKHEFYSFEVDEAGRIILTPYAIENE